MLDFYNLTVKIIKCHLKTKKNVNVTSSSGEQSLDTGPYTGDKVVHGQHPGPTADSKIKNKMIHHKLITIVVIMFICNVMFKGTPLSGPPHVEASVHLDRTSESKEITHL